MCPLWNSHLLKSGKVTRNRSGIGCENKSKFPSCSSTSEIVWLSRWNMLSLCHLWKKCEVRANHLHLWLVNQGPSNRKLWFPSQARPRKWPCLWGPMCCLMWLHRLNSLKCFCNPGQSWLVGGTPRNPWPGKGPAVPCRHSSLLKADLVSSCKTCCKIYMLLPSNTENKKIK